MPERLEAFLENETIAGRAAGGRTVLGQGLPLALAPDGVGVPEVA